MTAAEKAVWAQHFERLQGLLAAGCLILAGPTLGTANTGVVIFEAPDEEAARLIMAGDPVISGGYARVNCTRSGCRCCAGVINQQLRWAVGGFAASTQDVFAAGLEHACSGRTG